MLILKYFVNDTQFLCDMSRKVEFQEKETVISIKNWTFKAAEVEIKFLTDLQNKTGKVVRENKTPLLKY